jgi:chemotaxis protein MotB
MTETRNLAPIIIKKKKVIAGGGHHGGARKVAYADFVTAMMAFFMLMWLLNATTEKQRKGIADYFNPTIPVNRISGGGEGMFGGDSVFSEDVLPKNGTGGTDKTQVTEDKAEGAKSAEASVIDAGSMSEHDAFDQVKDLLDGNSGESTVADALLDHISTRITDEGLIVEMFDLPGEPLFENEGAEPSELLRQLIAMIVEVFSITTNQMAVNGHKRSYPVTLLVDPGWDMSTAQAHSVRDLLEKSGFDEKRIQRVSGWSDRQLAAVNPMSVRNNRIELILLRKTQVDTRY